MTFGRLLIALACGPLVFIIIVCAPITGICMATGRHLSDREAIAAAVVNRAGDIKALPLPVTADDIEAFIRDNPGCCSVTSTDMFWARWVQLVYEPKRSRDAAHVAMVQINECGRKIDYHGTSVTLDQMRALRADVRRKG